MKLCMGVNFRMVFMIKKTKLQSAQNLRPQKLFYTKLYKNLVNLVIFKFLVSQNFIG